MTIKRTFLLPVPLTGRKYPLTHKVRAGHKDTLYRNDFNEDRSAEVPEFKFNIEVISEDKVRYGEGGLVFEEDEINGYLTPHNSVLYIRNRFGIDTQYSFEPTLPSQPRK